jgi:uncharacterized protein YjiS (DUF1127 family)
MSIISFRFPAHTFVKHDEFALHHSNRTSAAGVSRDSEIKQSCNESAAHVTASNLLRDDHVVLLAINALVALHLLFRKWRSRRRTLRALAELDERQLRDIGLTREDVFYGAATWSSGASQCYRALAELDESQLSNLSEYGLKVRRDSRRAASSI